MSRAQIDRESARLATFFSKSMHIKIEFYLWCVVVRNMRVRTHKQIEHIYSQKHTILLIEWNPAAIKYNGYEVWPGNYSRSDDRIYDIYIKPATKTHSTQNTATFIRYCIYILQGKKNCIGHFDLSSTLHAHTQHQEYHIIIILN